MSVADARSMPNSRRFPASRAPRRDDSVFAVWDDHDYGENDAGGDYPMKEESRRIFLDFWKEPVGSPRWERDGVYGSWVFGEPGKRVQLILPDLRYNRTALTPLELGGYRLRNLGARPRRGGPGAAGTVHAQSRPQGHPCSASDSGNGSSASSRCRPNCACSARACRCSPISRAGRPGPISRTTATVSSTLIRRKRANGILFLSGDIHYAELSKQDLNVPYTLWDLTSSGLTEEWRVPTPNANRASDVVADANFGFIDIDWRGLATKLSIGIVDATGKTRHLPRYRAREPRRVMSGTPPRARRALRSRRHAGRQRRADRPRDRHRHGPLWRSRFHAAAYRDARSHLGARRGHDPGADRHRPLRDPHLSPSCSPLESIATADVKPVPARRKPCAPLRAG